jgi:hypothetical protein
MDSGGLLAGYRIRAVDALTAIGASTAGVALGALSTRPYEIIAALLALAGLVGLAKQASP